jgi:hypothetical protein
VAKACGQGRGQRHREWGMQWKGKGFGGERKFNIEHMPVKLLHVMLKVSDFVTWNIFGRLSFSHSPVAASQAKYNYISGNKIDKNMKIFVLINKIK